MTLHPRGKRAVLELRPEQAEFPRVDPRVVGTRHTQLYYPSWSNQAKVRRAAGFNAITRLDIARDQRDTWFYGDHIVAEEHIVIAKPGSTKEGEGWLIGTFFDAALKVSGVAVFDAMKLASGPIAVARMPYWIPFGFHGNWQAA